MRPGNISPVTITIIDRASQISDPLGDTVPLSGRDKTYTLGAQVVWSRLGTPAGDNMPVARDATITLLRRDMDAAGMPKGWEPTRTTVFQAGGKNMYSTSHRPAFETTRRVMDDSKPRGWVITVSGGSGERT